MQAFLWLVARKAILTWDNLQRRGCVDPSICVMCQQGENVGRLLVSCPYAYTILTKLKEMHVSGEWGNEDIGLENNWEHCGNRIKGTVLVALLWHIWLERNSRIF